MKRGITARQLTRAIQKDGYQLKRIRGSHHVFSHPDGRIVVVPYTKDSDTFPQGTLRQIASAVRWTDQDLTRLSHELSAAAPDPSASAAFRFVGLLDVLSSRTLVRQ